MRAGQREACWHGSGGIAIVVTVSVDRRSHWPFTLTVLAAAFLYAIIRYHVLKGVPWEHFPLFISNKAISLSAVAFIALSYLLGPLARFWPRTIVPLLWMRQFFGLLGFGLGAMHGLLSLLLFTPATYPKFFLPDGTLNLTGELSMLFGVLAFLVFTLVAISDLLALLRPLEEQRWRAVQRMGYLGLLLVLLHVVSMGYEGWSKPSTWPGGLLPISLVAAIIAASALVLRLIVLLLPGDDESKKSS